MLVDSPAFITKVLLPQRRADVLRRSRLVDFLHQHIDRRLLLVCAPAGYGKTTLLVDFARDVDIPICWYTLDAADADVRVFLEYLIAAIRQRFPEFGRQTEMVLRSSVNLDKELSAVVGALVSEMHTAIPDYFVLVLDDFHAVADSEQINTTLDLMLYYLPENCHIVIASRAVPRLTLSRLAAHRQVAGLGPTDLRFTADEIKHLLSENYKVLLPPKAADAIAEQSEGWITGIILSTYSMWQGLFETLIRAKGAGGEVFDYLASDVFAQQPPEVQRFLLVASVLEQIHPQLCAGLWDGDDAGAMLRHAEDANLFLTRLEGADGWYRFHQLFKAFLESRLRQEDPAWHTALQRRAAAMAAARGAWDQAIAHYTKAGDHDEAAATILARSDEMIDGGRLLTLARWIDVLPAEVMARQPRLLLVRGRLSFKAGEPERSLELLTQACQLFAKLDDRLNTARALATRSIALAIKGRHGDALADCERALGLIARQDARLSGEVYRNLGICHGMAGQFGESIRALEHALRSQRDGGEPYDVGTLHHSLGLANGKLGNVPKARHHFEQALAVWQRLQNAGPWADTLNSLGILLFEDGEHEAALLTFGEALAKAREGNYLRVEAAVLANIGDVHRTERRYDEAIEHYERSLEIARRIEEGMLVGYALDGLGDTHARLGEYRRADRFIRQAIVQAEERQSSYEIGRYETSLGMLRCDQGEPGKGSRGLARACDLLRESGAKRELARALLARARALHQANRGREALAQLKEALALGAEIDYEHFLILDGRRCEGVVAYAVAQGVADPRLSRALEALRAGDEPRRAAGAPLLQPVARPTRPRLEALALGQARVLRDGKEITRSGWSSDKVRELFFFLLGHPYSLTRDQIVEAIWPDLPTASCNSAFHSTKYRLRQALHGDHLVQRGGRYQINPDADCYYDVAEFERLLEAADRLPGEGAEAAAAYRQALAIYAGPYLKEFDAEWCEARRRQLATRHLGAMVSLAAALAAQGGYGESVELCHQALVSDEFMEEAHHVLLKCYLALSDDAAAQRHYRRYANLLHDELGVAPSPRIRNLIEQIGKKGEQSPTRRR